ncbi:Tetratricopeptide repeat protein [Rhodovastum atsumiense]|uniref:Tetratricopeptide repeat protein n=1 Tax=Rhodovastum atsumiense TaxID=504468 RepID=A0A5M6INU5_9PROT|nr:tetratricopeptide repeat-containing glycosyltransferase family protein [Rhodovastum atsumiense]KAA5609921.1 tetratricopeptide repeat protein [Rhodovastum atsumiense]CAH2604538.1 Tetratricopeptide repeat protein [Rhodovastum atsumiense]
MLPDPDAETVPPPVGTAERPDDAELHFTRGNAQLCRGAMAEAEACFRQALACDPGHALALTNLGSLLRHQDRPEEALAQFRQALARRPDLAAVHNNVGSTLLALRRPQEALAPLREAVRLAPDFAEACNNLGGALLALDAAPEAEIWFRRAVRLDPGHPQARLGLALALLTCGRFREGWTEYESRWLDPACLGTVSPSAPPLWRGEALAGRSLLLQSEQGLGDTIQFLRYAPLLRAQGARVVLHLPAALQELAAPLADAVIPVGAPLPACDFACPLMSLPHRLGTELATIPATIPYLQPPPARQEAWAARLGPHRGRRIGIVVSGSSEDAEDAGRSIPAAAFLQAFADTGAELHLLQTEIRAADRPALARVRQHDAAIHDFADTAALVSLMDLVVTVDSSPAHLAGALGAPVWILLQLGADFRWLRGRTDSPWYPTARLFRQRRHDNWDGVLQEVRQEIINHK